VSDPVTLLFTVAVFIEALWCIRATRRLAAVYQTRLFESAFFSRLVTRNKRVAYIGGGAIAAVVIWGLLSWVFPEYVPVIPRPWGSVLVGIALMVMLAGPILDERYVSRIRKGRDE
jgi:Zn-dependent protease